MSRTHKKLSWLGTVPTHWQILSLRQILTACSEKNHPEMPLLSVVREKGVIVRNIDDKNHNYVPDDLSNYKLVKRGQFAVNKMKAWQGSYGVSPFDGIVSPAYFVFNINYDMNHAFFNKAIRSKAYVNYFGQASDGIRVGQWDLSMKRLKDLPFCLPPRDEQEQIVRFLDWKISSINKIVSIKKKLLTTLEEQEKVLINNTILHGLDNSPLRDSGNSLIGKIPVTWDIIHLGKFCSFQNGISESGNFFTSGTPFVAYGDVYRHMELPKTVLGRAQSTEQQQEIFSVRKGDIFFTRTSENIEEVGMAAICKHTIEKAVFSGFVIRCRPRAPLVDIDYMKYYLQIPAIRNHFSSMMNIVIRASLSQNRLKQMPVVIPPMDEQKAIAAYLDGRHAKYTCFAETVQKEIFLLNELKKRLISDVVTGKIDVRHIEIPHFGDVPDDTDAYYDDAAEAVAEEE